MELDESLASQLASLMEKPRRPSVHSRFFCDNLHFAISFGALFIVLGTEKGWSPDQTLSLSQKKNGGSKGQLLQTILDQRNTSALTAFYLKQHMWQSRVENEH